MRKGFAIEGYIQEDGTVRPLEHYDDTELREKIQTNTDNIDNLDSRVDALEEHDDTKADKVEGATEDNFASLDENGNLQDSGKSPDDFASASHSHSKIIKTKDTITPVMEVNHYTPSTAPKQSYVGKGYLRLAIEDLSEVEFERKAIIDWGNIGNLARVLKDKCAYEYTGQLTIENDGNILPVRQEQDVETGLNTFIDNTIEQTIYMAVAVLNKNNHTANTACAIWWNTVGDTKHVHISVGSYLLEATRDDSGSDPEWGTSFEVNDISYFLETV